YVTKENIALVKTYFTDYMTVKNEDVSSLSDAEKKDHDSKVYEAFMKLRSNLPSGFEMWETITTNYLQLKTIYVQRHNHKLQEDWGTFCNALLQLPHFCELTGLGA
ncbi:MAG: hypothetical protein K6E51_04855, partial [Treponema sp.]|nr:hypothetical protein [Treponema sp.]